MTERAAVVHHSGTTRPPTRLQELQCAIAETFRAARELPAHEQRALLDYAIELLAREARRSW